MIELYMYANLVFIAALFALVLLSKSPWAKVLANRLLVTCLVVEAALYAVNRNSALLIDIALAFAILGFVDVQIYSVYLRKKGDL